METVTSSAIIVLGIADCWETVILSVFKKYMSLTHFLTGPALLYLILAVMNKKK